ncbi:MAG: hypothetical protein LBK06_05485 [Planctomycetaceae bacterium]|nr:hypothetical protein [Planctomycetaceae bacterium]
MAQCNTEAGKAIGFALEQPLHVVALPCSALRILKRLQQNIKRRKILHDVRKITIHPTKDRKFA